MARSRREQGYKKIDDGAVYIDGKSVPYRVYMATSHDYDQWLVVCDEYPDPIRERGAGNLADVIETAKVRIKKVGALDWNQVLMVEVKEDGLFDREGTWGDYMIEAGVQSDLKRNGNSRLGLTVEVTAYKVGTNSDGESFYRQSQRDYGSTFKGEIETGKDEDGARVAVVPDTPENREALDLLRKALGKLHGHLSEHLAPEKIEATLTSGRLLSEQSVVGGR